MIEGKRPERVLVKNDSQIVTCPVCGNQFNVSADARRTTCQKCSASINWGLGR